MIPPSWAVKVYETATRKPLLKRSLYELQVIDLVRTFERKRANEEN